MSDDIAIRTENLSKTFGRGAKADEAVKKLESHPLENGIAVHWDGYHVNVRYIEISAQGPPNIPARSP